MNLKTPDLGRLNPKTPDLGRPNQKTPDLGRPAGQWALGTGLFSLAQLSTSRLGLQAYTPMLSFLKVNFKNLICVFPAYMYAYHIHAWIQRRPQKQHWILQNWSYRWLWATIWVLETESRSRVRATRALNWWDIFAAQGSSFSCGFWGFKLRLSCLGGWHFTDWVIYLVLHCFFIQMLKALLLRLCGFKLHPILSLHSFSAVFCGIQHQTSPGKFRRVVL